MQHDTRASSLLQEVKYKQLLMADPMVCSTHCGGTQEKLSRWSASRYLESLQGEAGHILQCNLTLLLCPHYFLLCRRGASAWYDMRLFLGLGDKKKGRRTV